MTVQINTANSILLFLMADIMPGELLTASNPVFKRVNVQG